MNIQLSAELQEMVQARVQSGRYQSESEVVRDALRLLGEQDELLELRRSELREKITQGMTSLRLGKGIDGEEFFAQLEREEKEMESRLQSA